MVVMVRAVMEEKSDVPLASNEAEVIEPQTASVMTSAPKAKAKTKEVKKERARDEKPKDDVKTKMKDKSKSECTSTPSVQTKAVSREVATTCDMCQLRTQAVADLLLLTSDLRPVSSDALKIKGETFSQCQDIVTARTKELSVAVNGLSSLLHSITAKWHDICDRIIEVSDLVIVLIESCAHSAYLLGVNENSNLQKPLIDKYVVCRASIDIDVSCARVKHSSINELSPHKLVKICSEISKNLSILTESCRVASESVPEPSDQEQFKLCVKSITSNASCLLSAIRVFKSKPTETLHKRCIAFGEALTVSTNALVNFAIEQDFIGVPVRAEHRTKRGQTTILGTCMNTASAFIQLCQTVRALAYDNKNPRHRGRANLCLEALTKSTNQLTETMLQSGTRSQSVSPARSMDSLSAGGASSDGSIRSISTSS